MQYIHRTYKTKEPIAAIATAPGEGGVAIIRISGEGSAAIASNIFSKDVTHLRSHTFYYGQIVSLEGQKIDDVLLVYMQAPRSFTGEDVVEIHCHGGSLITRQVLEASLQAGARAALPGEFSFRSYMNGKVDLAQAEAIQSLIGAKSERALSSATKQLDGVLSKKIGSYQKELTYAAAIIEAWVDFPEEDLEFAPFSEVIDRLQKIVDSMVILQATFHQGRVIRDGLHLSLVGSPNVGKSSLMNALLGKERAIVSPHAGTTRDVIEDDLSLNGYRIRLLDTAGIRQTMESIEEEGIRRSKKAIENSDLILLVLDVTRPDCHESWDLLKSLPQEKTLVIWNKIDMPHHDPLPQVPFPHVAHISCATQSGLPELLHAVDSIISHGIHGQDEVVITTLRHKEALGRAIAAVEKVISGLKETISPEFVAIDIRSALYELGTIIGTDVTEDILTAIFSTFCIGK